ncbi:Ig-like domain-containing protein [Massilia agri]|uniref:Ig-like domain-containing protein n=1 Tax=Massilia agri TaxID=1886785 RepID=A0ABT2ASE8_9BURK|nr:Ig-like domain-containing protein [Massilia agri]MCS0599166.1 Ig-like domain-containing protein [Massilia agri]
MNKKTKYLNTGMTLLLVAVLSACGGGGGDPGTTVGGNGSGNGGGGGSPTAPATPTVAITFVNASGQASNSLTGATPLTVQATVRDSAGKPVPNALVSFATDNELAVFSPTAGTSLTDANGVATVTMRTASLSASGAGKVTATTAVAGTTVTSEGNYSVGATALSFSTLRLSQSSIPAYGSTDVSVDVLADGALYTSQQITVRLSSACVAAGKATLVATATTNQGTARAVYRDQGCGNNDVITASADGVNTPVTASLQIAPPAAASVQFVSAAPVDKSIVIRGQGGINRTETATLRFRVFDVFDRPLVGQAVEFSVVPNGAVTINKRSDTTDQNGEVITTVNSLDTPTTFRVQATLPGTANATRPNIFTLSDSIVVTTGLPVQRSLSLSTTRANVEGWRVDSGPVTPASVVRILLADQSGNPVADGTPIVFQTNLGAIGSSDRGGCTTVNGGCSVDFRTQNPRVAQPNTPATPCNTGPGSSPDSTRPGVATICASTTDGTNTQFGKTAIFFSGSFADHIFLNGSKTELPNQTVEIGPVPANDPLVFTLQLNDLNMNPLPAGSTVQVTGVANATVVGVVPGAVPNILPHNAAGVDDHTGNNVSGPQGSTHRFTISSDGPKPCTASSVATFDVTVTTPLGSTTSIPFKVSFRCS